MISNRSLSKTCLQDNRVNTRVVLDVVLVYNMINKRLSKLKVIQSLAECSVCFKLTEFQCLIIPHFGTQFFYYSCTNLFDYFFTTSFSWSDDDLNVLCGWQKGHSFLKYARAVDECSDLQMSALSTEDVVLQTVNIVVGVLA